MTRYSRPELLAPAGDLEKLAAAIHYGADAVYLGSSAFSLRSKAGNFEGDALRDAVRYAQDRGRKAYVTANIFVHDRDIAPLEAHAELLAAIGPDGVIVTDPGAVAIFRRRAPRLPVHISTQANVTNAEAARFWEGLGATRLVLSRELSIDEIAAIRRAVACELETFVHGAFCISYSGRCYISAFLAERSGNRGACTNSCRWNYALMEEKRPGEYMEVAEDPRGTYLMSPRDLCMVEHLDQLAGAGVDSFKIEGRIKGINYVAGVTKVYREAVDSLGPRWGEMLAMHGGRWRRELAMISNRGYTTGMFLGPHPQEGYAFDERQYTMTHEMVGIVATAPESSGGAGVVALRHRLDATDSVEFLTPGLEGREFKVGTMHDADGEPLSTGKNSQSVRLSLPCGVRPGDLVRRRKSNADDR